MARTGAKVLYAHPRVHRHHEERRDFVEQFAAIDDALEYVGRSVDELEYTSYDDLVRALVPKHQRYTIVVIAGHDPGFGLFDVAEALLQYRAAVFAELLVRTCGLNVFVPLVGCWSSELAPELALRGLRGTSYDTEVSHAGALGYVRGLFLALAGGHDYEAAFEFGCLAQAAADPLSTRFPRFFGPAYDDGRDFEWHADPMEE